MTWNWRYDEHKSLKNESDRTSYVASQLDDLIDRVNQLWRYCEMSEEESDKYIDLEDALITLNHSIKPPGIRE